MIEQSDLVLIGRMTRLHGKKGELQCLLCNDLLYSAEPVFIMIGLEGLPVPFRIEEWREKGSETVLFTLKGIKTEQQALRLVGSEVYLLRSDCAAVGSSDEETVLVWQDLVGYELYDANEAYMGRIESVDESTVNTLCQTDKDKLFPLHEDLIIRLDTDRKEIALGVSAMNE